VLARGNGWTDEARLAGWLLDFRERHDAVTTAAVFVVAWAVLTTFGFPALPLIIGGGALFGTSLGTLLSLVGTLLGALGGYTLARRFAPGLAARWVGKRVTALKAGERATFWAQVQLRVMPVIPFSAVNYAAGIAHVRVPSYVASTIVGQFPSTVLYAYLADRVVAAAGHRGSVGEVVAVSVALAVVSLVGALWSAKSRRSARAVGERGGR
jgi:uncharacterized membrane protein YdjX (TVP38/TMEM64 family)